MNLKKIIATLLSIVSVLTLTSCETFMHDQATMTKIAETNQQVKISKEARDFCENQPMVGIQRGFNTLINLKRDELKSAEVRISVSTYSNLSQKLEGYNAEFELTNQQMVFACRQHAICLLQNETSGMCRNAEANYQTKLDKASELLIKIKELEIPK